MQWMVAAWQEGHLRCRVLASECSDREQRWALQSLGEVQDLGCQLGFARHSSEDLEVLVELVRITGVEDQLLVRRRTRAGLVDEGTAPSLGPRVEHPVVHTGADSSSQRLDQCIRVEQTHREPETTA